MAKGLVACGGGTAPDTSDHSVGTANAAADAPLHPRLPAGSPAPPSKNAGVKIASLDPSSSHHIEFWEGAPGNVALVQTFHSAAGESPLPLERMLAQVGTFSGLYRKLLGDANAPLSAELLAADDHRRHLAIRDALVPSSVSAPSSPPRPARTTGPAATYPPVLAAAPSGLAPRAVPGGQYEPGDATDAFFHCPDTVEFDDGWCPGWQTGVFPTTDRVEGYFNGFVYGGSDESINWAAISTNPSFGTSWDYFDVYEYANGNWQLDLDLPIPPGYSTVVEAAGDPTYYWAETDGDIVGYGEHWQRSFPVLTGLGNSPLDVSNEIGNGLNGITHNTSSWILTKTVNDGFTYLGLTDTEGCLGEIPFTTPLSHDPGQCPVGLNDGAFNHIGDSVFDFNTNLIYCSTNTEHSLNGGVAIFSATGGTYYGHFVIEPGDQLAWVAHDPKWDQADSIFLFGGGLPPDSPTYHTSKFYSSNSAGTVIHVFQIEVEGDANGFQENTYADITIGNLSDSLDIQGGKVSEHGKLWVNAKIADTTHQILGINPSTGLIGVRVNLTYQSGVEAEGLDLTSGSIGSVGGEIHVESLLTHTIGDDTWSLYNFSVDDMSRL